MRAELAQSALLARYIAHKAGPDVCALAAVTLFTVGLVPAFVLVGGML